LRRNELAPLKLHGRKTQYAVAKQEASRPAGSNDGTYAADTALTADALKSGRQSDLKWARRIFTASSRWRTTVSRTTRELIFFPISYSMPRPFHMPRTAGYRKFKTGGRTDSQNAPAFINCKYCRAAFVQIFRIFE